MYLADNFQEARQKSETYYETKIREAFPYIPGLSVTVAVDVENSSIDEHSQMYDAAKTVVKPAMEETQSTETNTSGAPAEDPADRRLILVLPSLPEPAAGAARPAPRR